MVIARKIAIRRLNGLAPRVEEHLQALADDPDNDAAGHWRAEILGWLVQMQEMLPSVGKRTAADWNRKISDYHARLGDRS